MATDPDPLALPDDVCERRGWELVEQSTETLFQVPTARIRGTTCRYDDQRARRALAEATDGAVDHLVRFFATTRLSFQPSLPPGTGPAMVMPVLLPEARRNFVDRLTDRGLAEVDREGTERVGLGRGTRVRLTRYSANDPAVDREDLPLECWLGVWNDGGILIAACGYPTVPLADHLGIESDEDALTKGGAAFRDEFRAALREL